MLLGAQVFRGAAAGPVQAKLLVVAEIWNQAARWVQTRPEAVVLHQEQFDSQLRNLGKTLGLTELVIKKAAGRVGRMWRKMLNLHFKADSSPLWAVLRRVLGLSHLRSVVFKAVVNAQLSLMNSRHRDLASWGAQRWVQCPPGSHEALVRSLL